MNVPHTSNPYEPLPERGADKFGRLVVVVRQTDDGLFDIVKCSLNGSAPQNVQSLGVAMGAIRQVAIEYINAQPKYRRPALLRLLVGCIADFDGPDDRFEMRIRPL